MKDKNEQLTTVETVRKKMKALTMQRAQDAAEIREQIANFKCDLCAAEEAKEQAVKEMNVDSYATAEADISKINSALRMYEARRKQLEGLELVEEAESDRIIDTLISYEDDLNRGLDADIMPHLEALAEILHRYQCATADAEAALTEWQNTIHGNYRTFGRSNHPRSEYPVPVHITPYTGSDNAVMLDTYLNKCGMINY